MTKIMLQLTEANVLRSIKGKNGGYILKKSLDSIRVVDILEAVKECVDSKNCVLGIGACRVDNKCILHDRKSSLKLSVEAHCLCAL